LFISSIYIAKIIIMCYAVIKGGICLKEFYKYDDENLSFHYTLDALPDLKNEQFKMHTHRFNELYYCIRGKGLFCIEGTNYPLHAGDILIMRGAESHALEISCDEPYERMALQFDPEIIKKLGLLELLRPFEERELGKRNLFTPSDFSTPLYQMLLDGLAQKTENPRMQIISMLIPLLNELKTAFDHKKDRDTEGGDGVVKQIIDYINCHLADDLSLEHICERFYISKSQLCRIFKTAIGSGVWEYITIKRLMTAQQLIRGGTRSTKAADACGFKDYSVFYRSYRKYFGVSPKQDSLSEK